MESISASGIAQIMIDDGDYVTVASIHVLTVFTANFNASAQAHAQGTSRAR